MEKPIIAVAPLFDNKLNSIWMLPNYLDGIIEAGGIPVILPLNIQEKEIIHLASKFDGFLFTGGQDVNPNLYSEERMDCCDEINTSRDSMECILLEHVIKQDKPVLGICRGLQIMNVILGGSLYQDIQEQHKDEIKVNHRQKPPYDTPCHSVKVIKGTLLDSIVKSDTLQVNSLHHQAIKELSFQLKAAAVSVDGIVESVYIPGKNFVLAIQWHPEFLYTKDSPSFNIFKKFVDSCK